MKIALLLSGLPRMWHPSVLTQINMLAPHQVDIFFHFWDQGNASENAQILALTKPVAHIFEPQKDFSSIDANPDLKPDNINVPSRLVSQYYSWKQVADLFEPHTAKYDFALRVRSDLQFVKSINYVFPHLGKNDLVLPRWNEDLLSDLFAIGDPNSILYYHQLYDQLTTYMKDNNFNPELLLMVHLGACPSKPRIIVENNQQWFFVRRPHMANYTLEECMQENAGRNKWLDPEVLQSTKEYHAKTKGEEAGLHHVEKFTNWQINKLMEEKLDTKKEG